MTRFLLAAAAVFGGAVVWAGGPPPVYVIVDEVVLEPKAGEPERITIRGSFVRLTGDTGHEYGPPVAGSVHLSLDAKKAAESRKEWERWAKAAGTGKVVAVGMCSEAGALLKVKIRKPDERPDTPDAAYTPGQLPEPDPRDRDDPWAGEKAVKALKAFAKERKVEKAKDR